MAEDMRTLVGAGSPDQELSGEALPFDDIISPGQQPSATPAPVLRGTAVSALALATAACGGSSGSSGGGTSGGGVTPTPTPAPITAAQASRFLAQASFGATSASIAEVQSRGYAGWIADQIALPRTSHWDWLVAAGYNTPAAINNFAGWDNTVWRQMITEPGQLRQRVGMALLEIMVVGIEGLTLNWRQFAMAAYVDILLDNAFGNFRTIMGQITTNAAMGSFLTFLNNRRANATTGSVPDENYARELMQLFTLGLYRLNADGTLQLNGSGQPIETYTQADVSGLARVFTGFILDGTDNTTPDRYRRPMLMNEARHETGASTFLGATIPAGTPGMTAVNTALDTIFAHPNVPPFISKQLIQRLVTSNPSPAYVGRVSAVFANNGSGVRGDMAAVVRAILLDDEARGAAALTSTTAGKLREPVMRLTAWARAFGAQSTSGAWNIGDTSSSSTRLAQSMGRSVSVFNFFRPGYSPPNTAISTASLVAPEFQITNELSVVAYVNYMQALVANTTGDVRVDYTAIGALANDPAALVNEVNILLAAGQLSATTITAIRTAVESIATTAANAAANRVATAILLTLASPEFITLK